MKFTLVASRSKTISSPVTHFHIAGVDFYVF